MITLSHINVLKQNETTAELFKLCQFFMLMFAIIVVEMNQQPLIISLDRVLEQWSTLLPDFFVGKQDFLFSYGPLYWLQGSPVVQYSQASYFISLFFISLYCALNWALMLRLAINARCVFFFAVIYIVFIKVYNAYAVFFTLPLFIIVYLRQNSLDKLWDKKIFLSAAALLVAFLFYFRFFYGIVGVLTIGSYLVSTRLLGRRHLSPVAFFLSVTVLLYIIFGSLIFRDSYSIVNYALINSQLSFGNSVDMNYDLDIKEQAYYIIFAIFILFNFYLVKCQRTLFLTVNGLLLIFVKIGFSRADHYISYFIMPVALFSLLILVSNYKYKYLLAGLILSLLFYLGNMPIYNGAKRIDVFSTHEDFSKSLKERAAERHHKFKLPQDVIAEVGNSTIDVYPYNNEYTTANKLNYWHRPSFQNYMTLTPKLDQLNADFYEGNDKPEYVLWTASITCVSNDCSVFDDFDGKYILNEDPLTTMAILKNYKSVRVIFDLNHKPIMLMKKTPNAQDVNIKKTGDIKIKFGEWIKIPRTDDVIVKLKPQFRMTILARLQNLFFHGSVIYVNYRLFNGEIKRYRLNIINAQSGVWISPLLDSLPLQGQRVSEVMIETTDKHYFEPQFKAHFVEYQFSGISIDEKIAPRFTSYKPAGLSNSVAVCVATIDKLKQSNFTLDNVVSKRLTSEGWAAYSIEKNLAPQAIWLTLQDEQGRKFFVPADKTLRQDVANAFNKPDLVNAGYKVFADITPFKGQYKAGLAIAGEGKLIECANFAQPITIQ